MARHRVGPVDQLVALADAHPRECRKLVTTWLLLGATVTLSFPMTWNVLSGRWTDADLVSATGVAVVWLYVLFIVQLWQLPLRLWLLASVFRGQEVGRLVAGPMWRMNRTLGYGIYLWCAGGVVLAFVVKDAELWRVIWIQVWVCTNCVETYLTP